MYQYYEQRNRPSARRRLFRTALILMILILGVAAAVFFLRWGKVQQPVSEAGDVKQVSTVQNAELAVYDGTGWKTRFWTGMNLGATIPGHAPGELAPTKEDYLRWFPQMKKMHVDVLRVYTILEPEFYEALREFNSKQEEPLWLIQGVWSPEEELTGDDLEGRDAYTLEITKIFQDEITDAVHVVHGDANIPERPGHASGDYNADVSEYMLGWIVGTEWFAPAVDLTDRTNPDQPPFSGKYFRSTKDATAFESWGASMLDRLAREEMEYGWQHPAALSNWPTTDPLSHPDEANEQEDLVSVDPMHIEPTNAWKAGYFASYHIYPAFPDFMRYERKYQNYRTADGAKDPYAGYLHELRAYHKGIPLVAAEYGTSSARGMAHRGALGRDQGNHTEEAQGKINASLLDDIHDEGLDGGILFSWQDEWFKFAWNTGDLEIPSDRRPMWLNRLTNEQNYGIVATEPGKSIKDTIHLDGNTDDWEKRTRSPSSLGGLVKWISDHTIGGAPATSVQSYEDFDLEVTQDEAYLYALLRKRDGEWDFSRETANVGFGTLPGGSTTADKAPGVSFPGGIQLLLQIKGDKDSRLWINSAYDPHTWLYGDQLHYMPDPVIEKDPMKGVFLPWRLALNRPLTLPRTKRKIPFEDYEVGKMKPGITVPSDPRYNSLADWYAKGDVLEVRIPWTMLGFTDPSELKVWNYPYQAGKMEAVDADELRVYPDISANGEQKDVTVAPLVYTWSGWDQPTYHERKKKSYQTMREAFEGHEQVKAAPR